MLESLPGLWESLPEFGTGVLYAILVAAAYTFAVSVAAGRRTPLSVRRSAATVGQ